MIDAGPTVAAPRDAAAIREWKACNHEWIPWLAHLVEVIAINIHHGDRTPNGIMIREMHEYLLNALSGSGVHPGEELLALADDYARVAGPHAEHPEIAAALDAWRGVGLDGGGRAMTDAATRPRFAVTFSPDDGFPDCPSTSTAYHTCPACKSTFETLGDEARGHGCPYCGWCEGAPLPPCEFLAPRFAAMYCNNAHMCGDECPHAAAGEWLACAGYCAPTRPPSPEMGAGRG